MKRILSILLIAVMCVSFVGTAFAAGGKFGDVKESDWFYADVMSAVEMGLINGKSATRYAPNDNLTYAEAIKLAACMHQLYVDGSISLTSGNPWYKPYVDYCKKNGIIDQEYDYNSNATRAGYMGIFAKALPSEALAEINTVDDNAIPDVPSSRGYAAGVYKLYRAGILQGVDAAHNCKPLSNIKRSEVAAILTRMMDETKRVVFSMGEEEEEKPEEKDPEEVTDPEEKDPEEVTDPEEKDPEEVTDPEEKDPEEKDPEEVTDPETTEPENSENNESSGGAKDQFQPDDTEELKNEDFAFTIDGVYNVASRGIVLTGYISEGKVSVGDTVYLNDADGKYVATTTVKAIEIFRKLFDEAEKGDKPGINVDLDVDTYKAADLTGYVLSGTKRTTSSLGSRPTGSRPTTTTRPTTSLTLEISTQPQNAATTAGKTATLTVAVKGGKAPYTYQWQTYNVTRRGWVNLVNNTAVKGATTATLTLTPAVAGNARVRCIITDANGDTVTSTEALAMAK